MTHRENRIENKTPVGLANSAYWLGVIVLCANFLLYSTIEVGVLKLVLRCFGLACLALSVLLNFEKVSFSKQTLILVFVSITSVFIHGDSALNLLVVIVFALASSTYTINQVIKTLVAGFFVSLAIYLLLLLSGQIHFSQYVSTVGRARNTLGFSNVNAAAMFFSALLLLTYWRKWRHGFLLIALIVVLGCLFIATDTRSFLTFGVLFGFTYVLITCLHRSCRLRRLQYPIAIGIVALVVIASFAIVLLKGTEYDVALSYRPAIAYEALSKMSLTEVLLGASNPVEIDSSFIVLVEQYGLIATVIIASLVVSSLKRYLDDGRQWEPAFLVAVLIYSSMEGLLFRPELIISLSFWAIVFYGGNVRCNLAANSSNATRS